MDKSELIYAIGQTLVTVAVAVVIPMVVVTAAFAGI